MEPEYKPLITEEDHKRFVENLKNELEKRGISISCPRCQHQEWVVERVGLHVSPLPVKGMVVPPPHIPLVILTCKHCGWVAMHNLKVLGIDL